MSLPELRPRQSRFLCIPLSPEGLCPLPCAKRTKQATECKQFPAYQVILSYIPSLMAFRLQYFTSLLTDEHLLILWMLFARSACVADEGQRACRPQQSEELTSLHSTIRRLGLPSVSLNSL